jgi:hypothetical protein
VVEGSLEPRIQNFQTSLGSIRRFKIKKEKEP